LPAEKMEQIAKIRVKPQPFFSPPSHSAFHDATGLISSSLCYANYKWKPIGFKLCIGQTTSLNWFAKKWFYELFSGFYNCWRSWGGNGAAPRFSDGGMPFKPALIFVNKTLIRLDIRDKIRVICSGKIISGYSILRNARWERICATVQEVLCFH
jgi:glutamate synthase domain-containing protein 2